MQRRRWNSRRWERKWKDVKDNSENEVTIKNEAIDLQMITKMMPKSWLHFLLYLGLDVKNLRQERGRNYRREIKPDNYLQEMEKKERESCEEVNQGTVKDGLSFSVVSFIVSNCLLHYNSNCLTALSLALSFIKHIEKPNGGQCPSSLQLQTHKELWEEREREWMQFILFVIRRSFSIIVSCISQENWTRVTRIPSFTRICCCSKEHKKRTETESTARKSRERERKSVKVYPVSTFLVYCRRICLCMFMPFISSYCLLSSSSFFFEKRHQKECKSLFILCRLCKRPK